MNETSTGFAQSPGDTELEETATKYYSSNKTDLSSKNHLIELLFKRCDAFFYKFISVVEKDVFTDYYIDAIYKLVGSYNYEKCDKFLPYFRTYISKNLNNVIYGDIIKQGKIVGLEAKVYKNGSEEELSLVDLKASKEYSTKKVHEDNTHLAVQSAIMIITNRILQCTSELKKEYLSKIHSDYVASATNGQEDLVTFEKHEASIFKAMDTDFLNYFMEDYCDTIKKLSEGRTKLYKDISDEKQKNGNERLDLPLPISVYVQYYKLLNNKKDKSSISRYRENYNQLFKLLIKEEM